jgi:hypothetical protein
MPTTTKKTAEQKYSSEEEETTSVASFSSSATGTTTKKKKKRSQLCRFVLKSLAEDIEANGGIEYFTGRSQRLSRLLDSRVDQEDNPYGEVGQKIRKTLQTKKVYRWQLLHKQGLYLERVLNQLGVISYSNRMKSAARPPVARKSFAGRPAAKKTKRDDISSSADDSSVESSPRVEPTTKNITTSKPPPNIVEVDTQYQPITPLKSPPLVVVSRESSRTNMSAFPKGTNLVNVYEGIECFSDGFHIYWNDEMKAIDRKSIFSGLCIRKVVDPRWTLDEPEAETPHFEAKIFNKDTILIGYPGMDYDHFHNIDCFPKKFVPAAIGKKMDESRNRFAKIEKGSDGRKMFTALKIHPRTGIKDVVLSVKEIYRNDDFNNLTSLQLQYFAVKSKHSRLPVKTIVWYIQWNVVVKDGTEEKLRKRGKPVVGPKMSVAALMMLEQMNVYADDEKETLHQPKEEEEDDEYNFDDEDNDPLDQIMSS